MKLRVAAIVAGTVVAVTTPTAAASQVCQRNVNEDLVAHGVGCATASAVYEKSLRVCRPANMAGARCVNRFRKAGVTWRCRAFNPGIYVWRCTAPGDRLVRYRWLGGE